MSGGWNKRSRSGGRRPLSVEELQQLLDDIQSGRSTLTAEELDEILGPPTAHNPRVFSGGDSDNPLETLVFWLGLGASIAFLWLAWPVWVILGVTLGGWWLVRKRTDWWSVPTASILMSVSVGVGVVCVLLFVFNLLRRTIDPRWLYTIESSLVTFRMAVRGWTDLSFPAFVALIVGLVLLSVVLPRLKPVSRFLAAQSLVSRVVVALMAATSFTFFSQVPLERMAIDAHEELALGARESVRRYEAAVRAEWNAVGRYLVASYLEQELVELSDNDTDALRTLVTTVHEESRSVAHDSAPDYADAIQKFRANPPKTPEELREFQRIVENMTRSMSGQRRIPVSADEVARRVIRKIAAQRVSQVALGEAVIARGSFSESQIDTLSRVDKEAKALEQSPKGMSEWNRYQRGAEALGNEIRRQHAKSEAARTRASEAMAGLRQVFARTVQLGVPAVQGLAGEYLSEVVGSLAERVLEGVLREARAQRGSAPEPTEVMRIRSGPRPRIITEVLVISTVVQIGSRGVVAGTYKSEVRRVVRESAVREAETIRTEKAEVMRRAVAARHAKSTRGRARGRPSGR